jgi:hypothetical protein
MTKSQRGYSINSILFIVHHLFILVSIQEDSIPSNSNHNHDFESTSGDDEVHIHHQQQQQQKSNVPVVDIDCFDTPASLLDPQMAAYRAIMSRMVPFANNINGSNSLKRYVKQEPTLNQDESCHEDASDSQSPLNDRLSP